jgi:hypothetical protein
MSICIDKLNNRNIAQNNGQPRKHDNLILIAGFKYHTYVSNSNVTTYTIHRLGPTRNILVHMIQKRRTTTDDTRHQTSTIIIN